MKHSTPVKVYLTTKNSSLVRWPTAYRRVSSPFDEPLLWEQHFSRRWSNHDQICPGTSRPGTGLMEFAALTRARAI
ncbi:hypothetical protein RRG08_043124 [Elysia crispata]|uniref:Uncharacterized protein n=1 Tax=Elysia crispata TaxID=231223 RepID=A0AAE1CP84_9GAST|nr:hypothetical protein RRG08_043124 [Elysia crispata]